MTPSGFPVSMYNSLAPGAIEAYLGSKSWRKAEEMPGRAGVWTYQSPQGDTFDLLVPYRKDGRDYAIRVSDLVATLKRIEGRPVEAIIASILYVNVDVIQLRLVQSDANDDTLPWGDAVQFLNSATMMVASAAHSAFEPLPVFSNTQPTVVLEYLHKLRMGQTQRGSFIVNILSPVGSVATGSEPYERRVTRTLGTALSAIARPDKEAMVSSPAINEGVSANLCESLGAMAMSAHLSAIQIAVNLAPSIPSAVPHSSAASVTFNRDNLQELSSIGSAIREKFPLQTAPAIDGTPHQLRGYITGITRPKKALDGRISVETRIGTQVRHVHVRLTGDAFAEAALALKNRVPISCDGRLKTRGRRSLELIDPMNLQVDNGPPKESAG